MLVDKLLLFSEAQALTASAASTNSLDMSAARDIGIGEDLYVFLNVDVALTDSGSNSTVTVALEGDSTSTFTPDGSQELFIIPAVAAAGSQYFAKISPDFAAQYRYLRLKYTMNNGDLTTGTVTAGIVNGIQKAKVYPKGYTIS